MSDCNGVLDRVGANTTAVPIALVVNPRVATNHQRCLHWDALAKGRRPMGPCSATSVPTVSASTTSATACGTG